jgi:catecholate siderophore receptor
MDMDTRYLQSDYSGQHAWWGRQHSVQAGIDGAHEMFENKAATLPTGTTLIKPRTTVGTPDDGAKIDESLRQLSVNRDFDAKALGIYAQDLLQLSSKVKLLGGLRWDRFDGQYRNRTIPANINNVCSVTPATQISRADSLLSKRVGLLYQPSHLTSMHLSYGTSFNTSGDTYQYDAGTGNSPPESSRNLELGAKLDSWSGNFSSRFAVFHATKFNERNRDADSVTACNYVLSGKRHVTGFDMDLAGRVGERWELYLSYAFIPVAQVDASSGAPGTEIVGSRPGLTPRHSGTVWSTFQVSPRWRVGAGINARGKDRPVGLAANSAIVAPQFVTGDLLAEYAFGKIVLKTNITNILDKHYADTLYRGHYVAGKPRTLEVTATVSF